VNNTNSDILARKILNQTALSYLHERGISEDIALDLGFYSVSQTEAQQLINQPLSGMVISYFDFQKQPIAHRLRPFPSDWQQAPKLKQYYLEKQGELPKFLSRPKVKSDNLEHQRINQAYFSPSIDWQQVQRKSSIDILITEGEVKASLACLHGIPTIALPGVNGIYNQIQVGKETVREFLPELEWSCNEEYRDSYWKNRHVGLCFDSDIVSKWQVKNALVTLAQELTSRGAKVFIVLLPTEHDGSKNGIDDFIVRHGLSAFEKLIDQFKILQESKSRILEVNWGRNQCRLHHLEPINSIKGLMAWSCLKDQLAYREGYGWYRWTGKHWVLSSQSQVLNLIQSFRHANRWLNLCDEICLKEIKAGIANDNIKWNPSNIIGFNNGYLDTITNQLIPHQKNRYLTCLLPFDYKPSSTCPTWLKFLHSCLGGDSDQIEYVRAWFKWILSPKTENYPIEATLWLVGQQGTGKGTFLSVLRALVGKDNYGGFEPDQISNPNHLFGLIDKKLALNSDATGFIANVGIYNRICSNEPVSVKNLYQNQFNATLNTVTVMAMNKPIGFPSGGSEGLSRRLHVLKFDHVPSYRDPELKEKLSQELEGIFAWCWKLSMAQTKEILHWRVNQAVQEVYQGQITEILFLQNNYPQGSDCLQASELYQEYSQWSKENGYKTVNSQNFFLALKKIKGVKKHKGKNYNFYSIPNMKNYLDPEFRITTQSPTDIMSNTNEVLEGSPLVEGMVEGMVEGLNPEPEPRVEGLEGFSQKKSEAKQKNTLSREKFVDYPSEPSTIDVQQAFEPSTSENDRLHPSTIKTHKGLEGFSTAKKESLEKYKEFQSVGKLHSCDIREARNRSEKIKQDILVCTNQEELQLVREDFGYLPREIEWVFHNLLTHQQREQIKELTKRKQTELKLENEKKTTRTNYSLNGETTLDFCTMISEMSRILKGLGHQSKESRLHWLQSFTKQKHQKITQFSDRDLINAYQYLKGLQKSE
jgi:P4 family phage/plasmid primase-like protien